MQLLLDNLLATLIAGTLFLMMAIHTARAHERHQDMLNLYAFKKQELSLVETLKQDLQSVASVETGIDSPARDSVFRFTRRDAVGVTQTVEYRRVYAGTRTTDGGGSVVLYRIDRVVDGLAHAASMATVTEWEIRALNRDGNEVHTSKLDTADRIRVEFEAAAPYKEGEMIKRSRWAATFFPPLLQRSVTL